MPFTLPAATGAASLTDAATTEAQQKTNLTNQRGFIAEMLGTDSTSRGTARSLLGIDAPTLTFSVGSSAMTINMKSAAGADGSSTAPISMLFRSATLSSAAINVRQVTAALSLVVSSGSTLGMTNATDKWLYVYALDNSGTVELAISATNYGKHFIGTSVAEGGAGAADSAITIYSTTARTSVPMRLLGRVRSNQTTAGTWAAVPVESMISDNYPFDSEGIQLQTAVTLTTQTAVDFTSIPSWANRITVLFSGVSTNGTSVPIVQLGDSGGIETSGYTGSLSIGSQTSAWTVVATPAAGFGIATTTAAGSAYTGKLVIDRISGNEWIASGEWAQTTATITTNLLQGAKTLSAALTQVRLTTSGGSDQFDAGTVNISIE